MRRLHVAWLPDGKKLHLRNGRIDLILQGFGRPAEVGRAYDAAIERARALVVEMEEDLPALQAGRAPRGAMGRRAVAACAAVPGALGAVTALNGAVADEVLRAMSAAGALERGFVNNRGMVAFDVTAGHSLSPVAMDWAAYPRQEAKIALGATARSRGLAAAGWRFEAFALGWVERLYTAAPTAAVAEAALGSILQRMRPADVALVPAVSLAPESALGALPVCPRRVLSPAEARAMVASGQAQAQLLVAGGAIVLAVAELGEAHFLAGPPQFNLKSLLSLEANA